MKARIIMSLPLLLLAILLIPHLTATAKIANRIDCHESRTIEWDITGDGNNDTIDFVPMGSEDYSSEKLVIYINGEMKYKSPATCDSFSGYSFNTITLKNKTKYIFLNLEGEDEDAPGFILRYKNGKLYNEITLVNSIGKIGFHFDASFIKSSGNKVYFCASSMSYGLAHMKFEAIYQYKNGKLKVASKNHKVISYGKSSWKNGWKINRPKLTTSRPIKIYKDAKGKKYTRTLKSGTKVTFTKLYLTNTYCSFYIKGKGWYKVKHNTRMYSPPFKNIMYAG